MHYGEVLKGAEELINGDRLADYGRPEESFKAIAELWNAYLRVADIDSDGLEDFDVALMMALLKMARISRRKECKLDSFTDLAGYVALAADLYFRKWQKG